MPAVLLALCAATACVRGGTTARSGRPIDASGQTQELVLCQSVVGDEHARTDVIATTLTGLEPVTAGSQPGIESGVRGHPVERDVIVFARQTRSGQPSSRELFVSSLERRFADVRLTRDGSSDCDPAWSTDGGGVLFASDRSGAFALWRIGRDGSGLAPVTQPASGVADRAPDVRAGRIVFARTTTVAGAASSTIWIMNEDGSGATALTDGGPPVPSADEFVPGDHEPALAPDASQVVFARRTAADRAALMLVDLATRRVTAVTATTGGEDRRPRFTPEGDHLLAARAATAAGLLGRRVVAMRLDGSDVAQVTLDERLACEGLDFLAGAGAWPRAQAGSVAGGLEADDARIVLGRRTLGRFADVRSKNGSGLQLVTESFAGLEKAGVYVPFELPLADPSRVARVTVRATFALTVADPDARVRISVKDYTRDRYDVAWNRTVPNTAAVDASFTFASLAHVDRDGWIRIELVAELPEGVRAELALDAMTVDAFERLP
ncbi:MAG: hypothetical protein R3F56_05430 [Planctomycetota bacterium]